MKAPPTVAGHRELAHRLRTLRQEIVQLATQLRQHYPSRYCARLRKAEHLLASTGDDLAERLVLETGDEEQRDVYAWELRETEQEKAKRLAAELESMRLFEAFEPDTDAFSASLKAKFHCKECWREIEPLCPQCRAEKEAERPARRRTA